MRVLCVARHEYLSEHFCRFFDALGVDTIPCVSDALRAIPAEDPDAVICDYDLLATIPITEWENDPVLGKVPVIAVSLTRHPGEAHLLDINSIAGFLYLPTLEAEDAHRLLSTVRRKRGGINPPNVLMWPGTTPIAHRR